MISKFIGLKEFRQNLTKLATESKKKNIRYIVMKKNKPIFEVNSINEKEYEYLKLDKELREAEAQIKRGEFYTTDQVKEMLGLK